MPLKRIIVINHYGATPDVPGPSRNYELSRYIAEKSNCRTEFWISGYSHYTRTVDRRLGRYKIQHKETEGLHTTVRLRTTRYRKSVVLRQLNTMVFDLLVAFKLLFSLNVTLVIITVPPLSLLSPLVARLKRIPVILDVQDLWPLFLVEMGLKSRLAVGYMNWVADLMYGSASGIACVSDGMAQYVRSRVGTKHIWVSPLGVNFDEYSRQKLDPQIVEGKPWRDNMKIMYLGAHGRANDLLSVLTTVKEVNQLLVGQSLKRPVSFIFVGDGEQKATLVDYAKQHSLMNVFFEDAVPSKEVPAYLRHADVCLTNLMKIDSFKLVRPNKLFQYMALGKPIISGIAGEFQRIIEDVDSGIYVDFTRPKDAAHKIVELISDADRLKEMGKNGVEYIRRFGDRRQIFSEFWERVNRVLAGHEL